MPRPQGHRKSRSTSALAFLASQGDRSDSNDDNRNNNVPSLASSGPFHPSSSPAIPPTSIRPPLLSRSGRDQERSKCRHRSQLPSVAESSSSASLSVLPGLTRSHEGHAKRSKFVSREVSSEMLEEWLSDVRSLRSSTRRRVAALKGLEQFLVEGCVAQDMDMIKKVVSLQVHHALLSLLTRHTQTLSQFALQTAMPEGDERTTMTTIELTILVKILQGLCLLSRGCKRAVSEGWALEMFIDMLLLLRAQQAQGDEKAIAYNIMELLFCVLVDSPETARRFEKLSGLEAIVRVLKGTGVTKDVRMKCIEFLYFYLLPEQTDQPRVVSSASSSSSSTSSVDSPLYPPSPLSSSPGSNSSVRLQYDKTLPAAAHKEHLSDVDMPFVPMTPRKPPQPALGYLTPSTHKLSVGASASSTSKLPTVPASPRVMPSSSSRGLAAMLDEMDRSGSVTGEEMPTSGRKGSDVGERVGIGLGRGLPKVGGMTRTHFVQRRVSPTNTPAASPSFVDPFCSAKSSERSHSGSSGSSTVVPSSRSISRSSTQPSLAILQSGPYLPNNSTVRRLSVRRVSKSPLVQSTVPANGATPEKVQAMASDASSSSAAIASAPRTPKIRHSRTQSHLSALPPPPPVPPVPDIVSMLPPAEKSFKTPSRPHRAFPSELTKGLPPSASSPSLSTAAGGGIPTPLGASKRISSDKRMVSMSYMKDKEKELGSLVPAKGKVPARKVVKSVEEKKEMLGMWLGNVEQLVQGVEKVSLWGSIGNAGRGKK
ncbi:hypothetical protein IAR55_005157 [Kwoniella newhampshirensis]|uniref:Uncharacterized protein n=1 Tax=Kwoniella newhampshirensis TaxID=1651941 RepID=A0AAW0YWW7_9TREE